MDADLDTLATALYVTTDDLLKAHPERVPWRPAVGIQPRVSDAEIITLAVMQALLSFTSEARFLRYANKHLRQMFPVLPTSGEVLDAMLDRLLLDLARRIRDSLQRQALLGDKNYYGKVFETDLTELGIDLIRPTRSKEKPRPGQEFVIFMGRWLAGVAAGAGAALLSAPPQRPVAATSWFPMRGGRRGGRSCGRRLG